MTGDVYRAAYEAALKAPGSSGFYNKNVRIDTASGPVIVRIPCTKPTKSTCGSGRNMKSYRSSRRM